MILAQSDVYTSPTRKITDMAIATRYSKVDVYHDGLHVIYFHILIVVMVQTSLAKEPICPLFLLILILTLDRLGIGNVM